MWLHIRHLLKKNKTENTPQNTCALDDMFLDYHAFNIS